jgi:hypothetical protein
LLLQQAYQQPDIQVSLYQIIALHLNMSKFGRKIKQSPPGFEVVEPTLTALEAELRDRKKVYLNLLPNPPRLTAFCVPFFTRRQ